MARFCYSTSNNFCTFFFRYLILLLDRRMPTPKRPYYGGHKKRLIDIQMSLFTISPILGGMDLHLMQFFIAIGMYYQIICKIEN